MAKSESTKYRLAEAMKTCMKTTSVDDITIRQIVEVCGVTRQTFYRNFLDKYDLINWYFDKLLLKSFEHMGEGTTVYDGLVKKFEYLKEHGREPKAVYHSDPDAHYVREYTFDLSKVEPVVAKPDFVDNLAPAKDVRGIKIDEAFLGSCNNGRIEDLRVGAQVIKGKKVSEKVRFLVVPASQTIYRQALEEGLIDIFMDAGAIVMNPNCSVCWGSCQGVIGENEVLISTGTRNFKGRAGHPSSKVYLGSAATVTASAIAGEIALASDV